MFDKTELVLVLWFGVIAVALLVEAATPMLVSIWFALGALVALIAAYFGASPIAQVMLFVFTSLTALALARPLAKRLLDPHIVPTNADRLPGTLCRVTETIDERNNTGAVYADGKTWTARTEDHTVIASGEQVEILRMEGVKLIVRLCETGAAVQR